MTDIIYRKDNSNFILSMNGLNIFTTLFIYYKKGFLSCVPHGLVCISSYCFWSEPRNNYIMYLDYLAVFNTICFSFYRSIKYKREHIIAPILNGVFFTYFVSMHFKNKKNEDLSVYAHSLTYLLGNIGIAITFT